MWKKNEFMDTLYEVRKQWPDSSHKRQERSPVKRTPVHWHGEIRNTRWVRYALSTWSGLDQMLREFILVSLITKQMVSIFN